MKLTRGKAFRIFRRLLGASLCALLIFPIWYVTMIPHVDESIVSNSGGVLDEKIAAVKTKSLALNNGSPPAVTTDYVFPTLNGIRDQIPVLIIACNRPQISRCLDSVFRHKPSDMFPVIVSQDCDHLNTSNTIDSYSDRLLHLRPYDHREYVAYYKISRHYKWALTQIFDVLQYEQVIIIEDDMEVAPDFFDYFQSFLPVLKADNSLLCVSAWNDNGKIGMVEDSRSFYKSDFFPGLGWMLRRTFWQEIRDIWPRTFWDDWLRHPDRRKNRGCIRPEISRTFNFGKVGVSGGIFYDDHIGKVMLNHEPVSFSGVDVWTSSFKSNLAQKFRQSSALKSLEHLSKAVDVRRFLKEYYDEDFKKQVYDLSARTTSGRLKQMKYANDLLGYQEYVYNPNVVGVVDGAEFEDVNSVRYCGKNCRRRFTIPYKTLQSPSYRLKLNGQIKLLTEWSLMDDIREDCARTAYMDIVSFKVKLDASDEYVLVYVAPETPQFR